jgi:hypothetical protein
MGRIHTARKILEVAFGNVLTDPAYTFTDITPWLQDVSGHAYRTGRQNELQQFDAGDGNETLINNDRRFEPEYAGSPYYPNIDLEKPIQFSIEYPWLPGQFQDGSFEQGLDGWTRSVGTGALAWVPGGGWLYLGASGLRYTAGAGEATPVLLSSVIAVTAGEPWYASIRLRSSTAKNAQVKIRWYSDAGGTALISDSAGSVVALAANTWTRVDVGGIVAAPAGAVSCRVSVWWTTPANGNTLDLSHAVLDQVNWFTAKTVKQLGYVDDWLPSWNIGTNTVTVRWHDGFKALGLKDINNRAYKDSVIAQGWKYYWPMDELVDSTTAHDIGSLGARMDEPLYGSGIFGSPGPLIADPGTALDLYGGVIGGGPAQQGLGYFNLGDPVALVSGIGGWSMCFWFNISGPSDRLIQQGPTNDPRSGSVNNFWNLYENSTSYSYSPGGWQFAMIDKNNQNIVFNTNNISPGFQDGQWHFMTMVIAANYQDIYFYIDGLLWPCNMINGGTIQGDGHFRAGAAINMTVSRFLLAGANDAASWSGQIAHVGIAPGVVMTLAQHQTLYNIGKSKWTGQTISQRMSQVLDIIGFPTWLRDIDYVPTVANDEVASLATTNSLEYFHGLEKSDSGWLFMSPDGKFTYRARATLIRGAYTQVQWVLSDRGGETDTATGKTCIPYSQATPQYGDENLYNEAQVSRQVQTGYNGAEQLAGDYVSQQKYFKRTAPAQEGLLLASDADALGLAQWEVAYYGNPRFMFTSVKMECFEDLQWQMAVQAKLGDRVAVWVHPMTNPTTTGKRVEAVIQGISAGWGRFTYEVTFSLGMIPPKALLLDDPVYGLLDSGNVWGY